MEISGKLPPPHQTAYADPNAAKVDQQASAKVARGDRVELSPQARELQAARRAVAAMDDVDHAKVARIKAQIAAGDYEVDALKTAGKMIEESLLGDLK